jgi:HPt (histidine-containing phosphotransfer) domain-containing protein
MAKLAAALEAKELGQAADVCHTLKSSAANVGAKVFSESVRELEKLCREGDAVRAAELHARLATAYEPLLEGLRGMQMAESA